jgi:hypothetical protein
MMVTIFARCIYYKWNSDYMLTTTNTETACMFHVML